MPFIFRPVKIPGLLVIESSKHKDERGFFMEAFKESEFGKAGINMPFVQDNYSVSVFGVLRGMHFQKEPFAQGRFVMVLRGRAFDVVVDLRSSSKSFGEHFCLELGSQNGLGLWIPPGFAHGFMALEDETELLYKCTSQYSPEHEDGIRWNDPVLNIPWPKLGISPLLSQRDRTLPFFDPGKRYFP